MHIPVLYQEVLSYLQPKPHGKYIDGTVGAAGHAKGILEASEPNGTLLAIDRDPAALDHARQQLKKYGDRVTFIRASYGDMDKYAPEVGFEDVDGILLDLGLSSRQLDDASRGFSFSGQGSLDMRFDPSSGETASELLDRLSETEISEILRRYGEEKASRRLAQAILENRPIETTEQLVEVVLSVKGNPRRGRIHPATLVFQALRIAVNSELAELENGLSAGLKLLNEGGHLAVISFHSLEDRIVKQFIRDNSKECICPPKQPICTCNHKASLEPVTRRVVRPRNEEIASNPRSRSAKLRVAQKLAGGHV